MGIVVDWGNAEETVLIWRYGKQWTASDIKIALFQSKRLIASRQVDIIIDVRYVEQNPMGLLRIAQDCISSLSAIVDQIVVLDGSSIFYSLYKMMENVRNAKADPKRFHIVKSVDEAYALVNIYDNEIIQFPFEETLATNALS